MNLVQRLIFSGGMIAIAVNAAFAPRVYSSNPGKPASRAYIFSDDFFRADTVYAEDLANPDDLIVFGIQADQTWNPVELDSQRLLASTIAGSALTLALFAVAGLGSTPRQPTVSA